MKTMLPFDFEVFGTEVDAVLGGSRERMRCRATAVAKR